LAHETCLLKAHVAPTSHDDGVVYRDIQQAPGRHQLFRHCPVFRRRRRIAARMIVDQNHRCCPLRDRFPEHFPRMHQRRVQQSPRDQHVAFETVLRVAPKARRLVLGSIGGPTVEIRSGIGWGGHSARTSPGSPARNTIR